MTEKNDTRAEQIIKMVLSQSHENQIALHLKAVILSHKKEYQKSLTILNKLHESEPKNIRFLLDRAGIKYQQKDYKGVDQDLSVLLKQNENLPSANSLMSLSKLYQKDYKSAMNYAQKVLNILPEHYMSMFVIGVSDFALGNLNQAEKYLNQVLFKFPDNLDAQSVLSNLYIAKKEGEQALLILESIDKDMVAESANLSLSLGTAYLLTGNYEKGIDALNNAKKLEPDNKLINERLVAGYFSSKDFNKAIMGLEAIAADKENKQAQYLLVITYIQNKEFDKAKETIERLKIQSPNDPNLYNFQAALYLINNNKESALLSYYKSIEIDENYIPAYLGIIRIYMADKQYDQADDLFKKILSIDNKYVKAWLGRASIAENAGNKEKVEFFIKEGLKNSKGEIKSELIALTQLAKWYNRQGQKKKVLELGREIIQRYPKSSSAQFFQANALLLNGKSLQAEGILEKLLYNDQNNRKYQLLLISLLVEKKENQRAISLLDNILKSKPDDKRSVLLKGKLLAASGENNEAIEVSQHYQKLFPEDGAGYQLEGDILFAEKKYEKAFDQYQAAFKKDPSSQVMLKIIDLYIRQKKTNEAIEFLNSIIVEGSSDIVARYRLALLLQKQKKNGLAIEQYQIILSHDPENVLVLNNLAWVLSELGDDQALNYAKKAYELKSDSPAILDTYGYILLKERHLEDGVKILQKAADLAPKAYDIHYHLAEGFYLTGDTEKAKEKLTAILSVSSNFSEKENAKVLFNKLQ